MSERRVCAHRDIHLNLILYPLKKGSCLEHIGSDKTETHTTRIQRTALYILCEDICVCVLYTEAVLGVRGA